MARRTPTTSIYSVAEATNRLLSERELPSRGLRKSLTPRTLSEQCSLFVLCGSKVMVQRFFEEAAALASITLFLATIAVWIQVLGVI